MEWLPSILRKIRHLRQNGCDLNKLHEYFGYTDSYNHVRKISLKHDPSVANVFTMTVNQMTCHLNPLQTYIDTMPRDVNNLIYSYVKTHRSVEYRINIPDTYPFAPIKWTLVSFFENSISKNDDEMNPNDMYCGNDHSPALTFDKQILIYLSVLPWLQQF